MKRVFDSISIFVFVTTCIWFGYIYYQKYSLENICSNIKSYNQHSIDQWQNMLDNCISIEEMIWPISLKDDYLISPDSIGVDWYDKQLQKQEIVSAKIGMLYTTTSDIISRKTLLQDQLSLDIVFGLVDHDSKYSCTSKVIKINGKDVFYKKPVKVSLPKNKTYLMNATLLNYNGELAKIDSTIIASRTLLLN